MKNADFDEPKCSFGRFPTGEAKMLLEYFDEGLKNTVERGGVKLQFLESRGETRRLRENRIAFWREGV